MRWQLAIAPPTLIFSGATASSQLSNEIIFILPITFIGIIMWDFLWSQFISSAWFTDHYYLLVVMVMVMEETCWNNYTLLLAASQYLKKGVTCPWQKANSIPQRWKFWETAPIMTQWAVWWETSFALGRGSLGSGSSEHTRSPKVRSGKTEKTPKVAQTKQSTIL